METSLVTSSSPVGTARPARVSLLTFLEFFWALEVTVSLEVEEETLILEPLGES